MSSDVVLSSALRTNLQSLQNTQRLIDDTQLKLATGLKVNSALDNPQSFFAAQSLNNRANDLGRLLDGISQSIRTIESADNGIKALTSLVEQAESVATSARDALSGGEQVAKITGNVSLSGVEDLGADIADIDDADDLLFTFTDQNGDAVTFTTPGTDNSVEISDGDNIGDLLNKINGIRDANGNAVVTASLTSEGFLELESLTGGALRVNSTGTGDGDLLEGLGFGQLGINEIDGTGTAPDRFAITATGTPTITSQAFYEDVGGNTQIADASTLLTSLENSSGVSLGFAGDTSASESGDNAVISINNGAFVNIGQVADLTIQGTVDSINSNANLNEQIRAEFDSTTGQISIVALDASVESIQIGSRESGVDGGDTAVTTNFGFGIAGALTATDADSATVANVATESIRFGESASQIAQFENDYNSIRGQIDTLVQDAGYRGVNLLNGDDLVTNFNEDNTSSLTSEGVTFTSAGLGISEGSFGRSATVEGAITEIRAALTEVRNFGSSLANDLAVIQTRRDFTETTINTLEAGADDLTVADQNEEGANLLSLQTRQQLAVTSLSLASQSQQAVLRLF